MKIHILFPCLLILSAWACKKPLASDTISPHEFNQPIIFYTSLRDTIPKSVLTPLHLDHVNGIKVKYPSGLHNSYFEYEADHTELIRTIGSLPFPLHAELADTTCHTIPFEYIRLSQDLVCPVELENSAPFWSASEEDYVAYACLKAPYKHTLLFSKNSKRVLHRIEFIG